MKGQDDKVFVFQVIHDLRHPIQAQHAIIGETLTKVQKRNSRYEPWFTKDKTLKMQHSVQKRLEKLKNILSNSTVESGSHAVNLECPNSNKLSLAQLKLVDEEICENKDLGNVDGASNVNLSMSSVQQPKQLFTG